MDDSMMVASEGIEDVSKWRKSLVGKDIEIKWDSEDKSEFWNARVQSCRAGVFTVTYYSDGSVEKIKLLPDFTASSVDDAAETTVWRHSLIAKNNESSEEKVVVVVKQKFTSSGIHPHTIQVLGKTTNNEEADDDDEEEVMEEKMVPAKRKTKKPLESTPSPSVGMTRNKRVKLDEKEKQWCHSLLNTTIEIKGNNDPEWLEAHVDKVHAGGGMFTLFLVELERLEHVSLLPDFTGVYHQEEGEEDGENGIPEKFMWRSAAFSKSKRKQEWRESIVNRVISIPYNDEWLEANVEEDLKVNDLFVIRYLGNSDNQFEQVKLFENFSGSDPQGEEEFSWKLLEDRVAEPEFPYSLLGQKVEIEFDGEWFVVTVEAVDANKSVTLRYEVDNSLETVILKSDFTGIAGDAQDDVFQWKVVQSQ